MGRLYCLGCKAQLSASNPHSKCDKCLLSDNGVLCAPNSCCPECQSLTDDGWKAFLSARKKAARDERYRSTRRSQSASHTRDRSSSLESLTDPQASCRTVARSVSPSPSVGVSHSRDASPVPVALVPSSHSDLGQDASPVHPLRQSHDVLSDLGDDEAQDFLADLSPHSPVHHTRRVKKHKKHKKHKKSGKHSSKRQSLESPYVTTVSSFAPSTVVTHSAPSSVVTSSAASSVVTSSASSTVVNPSVPSTVVTSPIPSTVVTCGVASTVVTPAIPSSVSSTHANQASSSPYPAPPSPSQWRGFRQYLESQGLVLTPAVPSVSSTPPAPIADEEYGPTPAKLQRREAAVSPSKRKVPSSRQASSIPASARLGPSVSLASSSSPARVTSHTSSVPGSAPYTPSQSSPYTDRREVSFSDQVHAIPVSDPDREETPAPGGIESLSDIYHPRVRLSLIGNVLDLSPPEVSSSGYTSSLVDDISIPKLVLPHGQLMSSLAEALDKSMAEAPAFKASSSMAKPSLPDAPMMPLPFHERAHAYDSNLHLLGKSTDLKRYTIFDESLAQVDSTIRKSLRHLSLLEQTTRAINVMSEGTEPLYYVSIRSLGETLLFSLSALADASAWVLGSVCYLRRRGILSRRDAAWSDADCTRLLRSPWSSDALLAIN